MNIRAREEHNYSRHQSYSYTTVEGVCVVFEYTSCPAGHSACRELSGACGDALKLDANNITDKTKRALPVSIRNKSHSHLYVKVVSTPYDTIDLTSSEHPCGAAHSCCDLFWSGGYVRSASEPQTELATASYSPEPPVSIRAKMKHKHRLRSVVKIYNRGVIKRLTTCPLGHASCKCSGSAVCTSYIEPGEVDSSSNYE